MVILAALAALLKWNPFQQLYLVATKRSSTGGGGGEKKKKRFNVPLKAEKDRKFTGQIQGSQSRAFILKPEEFRDGSYAAYATTQGSPPREPFMLPVNYSLRNEDTRNSCYVDQLYRRRDESDPDREFLPAQEDSKFAWRIYVLAARRNFVMTCQEWVGQPLSCCFRFLSLSFIITLSLFSLSLLSFLCLLRHFCDSTCIHCKRSPSITTWVLALTRFLDTTLRISRINCLAFDQLFCRFPRVLAKY